VLAGLALAGLLFFQLPQVQNWAAQRVVDAVRSKLGTEVSLRKARVLFFNSVRLEGFYLEDQQGDTLLYSDGFKVDLKFFGLLRKDVIISQVEAEGAKVNLKRDRLGALNFQFVIDAFAVDEKQPAVENAWDIDFRDVKLSNARVYYDDQYSDQSVDIRVPLAEASFSRFNQKKRMARVNHVGVQGVAIRIAQGDSETASGEVAAIGSGTTRLNPAGWDVKVRTIDISDSRLDYYKEGHAVGKRGYVDYRDLALSHISGHLADVAVIRDTILASLSELAFQEKSGFELTALEGQVRFSPEELSVNGMRLTTPHSEVRDTISLRYENLRAFSDVETSVDFYLNSNGSVVSSTDLRFVIPNSPYDAGGRFELTGVISGKISSLRGRDLVIDYGANTHFVGEFYTDGLPRIEETFIDLTVDTITSTRSELGALVPNLYLPPAADKLGKMRFSGSFQGFVHDFVAYGELNSALGYVKSDINMKFNNARVPSYSGNLALRDFHLGQWLDEDPILGTITASAKVSGVGFGEDLSMNMEGRVEGIAYNGYTYRNIDVKGELKQRFFDGQIYVKDPNLSMNFLGTVNFQEEVPVFDLVANITRANLQGLNFTHDYLAVKTLINFDFTGLHPDSINGTAVFVHPVLMTSDNVYNIDTVRMESVASAGHHELNLTSEIVDASVSGDFQFEALPIAVMHFVNRHYAYFVDTIRAVRPQSVTFRATVKEDHKLTRLIDKRFTGLSGATVSGSFNSASYAMQLRGSVPELRVGEVIVLGSEFGVRTEGNALIVSGQVDSARLSPDMGFTDIVYNTRLDDGKASFSLTAGNDEIISKVEITGRGETHADSLTLRFAGSKLWVKGHEWTLDGASELMVDRAGIRLRDFRALHEGQLLVVNTSGDGDHLNVELNQIELADLLTTMGYDKYRMAGRVTGRMQVREYRDGSKVFVKLNVHGTDMSFEEHPLGSLDVAASYDVVMSTLLIDAEIIGDMTSALITGVYSHSGPREDVQLKVDLKATPLVVFEPLFEGIFSEMEGSLTAKVDVTGNPDDLQMRGAGRITNGGMKVDYMGTVYSFADIPVNFSEHVIVIDSAVVRDENGAEAVVTGGLTFTSLRDMRFAGLRIETDPGFKVMQTTSKDNPDFYGTAYGKAVMRLNGPFDYLDMDISIRSSKGTKISLPIVSGVGYSRNRFVTFRTPQTQAQPQYKPYSSPLAIRLHMDITPDAEVEIIFDERAGDIIRSRGNGSIDLYVSRNGDLTTFGLYTITGGEYRFTLRDVVNKAFVLRSGSRIRFTGDPYEAIMEITAVYQTRAVPYDLLSDMVGRLDEATIKQFKQPVDIDVLLHLGGTLDNPTLRFGLEAPDIGAGSVGNAFQARLEQIHNDTAELNKQAFGLLVLRQFVPTNFGSQTAGSGVDVGTSGVNTMTEFLTSQLSRYFSDWLARYDAQVGFNYSTYSGNDPSDPEGYSRNELDIELQKKLGKVTIDIGGSFEFGQDPGIPSNTFAGDFQVTYDISDDGRIKLLAFRRSDYDAFSSSATGTVYKTGAGVLFGKDFDRWEELFRRQ
jgi:hypothetical protein